MGFLALSAGLSGDVCRPAKLEVARFTDTFDAFESIRAGRFLSIEAPAGTAKPELTLEERRERRRLRREKRREDNIKRAAKMRAARLKMEAGNT